MRKLLAIMVAAPVLVLALLVGSGGAVTADPVTCKPNGHFACPTPPPTTTTTTSPTPTTSTTTTPPGSWSCTHYGDGGCPETFAQTNCPAPDLGQSGYCYPGNSNSNGWNTYVNNDCWGSTSCGTDPTTYKLEANSPGDWQTTVLQGPAGDTAVHSYPDVQQLYDYTPITSLTQLTSTYAETMPAASTGTIAQFAWDIWVDGPSGTVNEIMVWVDNKNRGSGGATQVGTATIAGQDWTIYQFGDTELIFSLGAPGTFAQQSSGTVDLLAVLNEAIAQGFISADRKVAQVNAGWEICSTGGAAQTFRVTDYTLTS
jgi:hypothetical protein